MSILTFKQFYKKESDLIRSEYSCTFKDAIECLKLRLIQNEYVKYLESFDNIPNKIVKTIPFEPKRNLFIKYNMEKIK